MSMFDSMKQPLLEAIEMEYGKDKREKVIRELNLSEKEHRLITEYNHLIATGQFALAVEFLNDNPRLLEDHINLLTDDIHKEVIDKMNEVPNTTWYTIKDEIERISNMNTKEIKIKYHNKDIEKLTYIDGKSDWIDLRAAEDVVMKAGEFKLINLGVSMKLPEGYEAHIVPRSSTFKNFHIIQTNHQAVIDNSYCGDNDVWRYPVYAMEDTEIHFNDRICQFRIVENQPKIHFNEVEFLNGVERGGFGSTGKQ